MSLNIKIHTTSFELTPAIEEYVSKKISSLEKFLDPEKMSICEMDIGMTSKHHKSGNIFKAEINLVEPGMQQIFAVAEEEDLYAAIDVVRDEAERVIVSKKKKHDSLLRRGGARIKNILKRITIRR